MLSALSCRLEELADLARAYPLVALADLDDNPPPLKPPELCPLKRKWTISVKINPSWQAEFAYMNFEEEETA